MVWEIYYKSSHNLLKAKNEIRMTRDHFKISDDFWVELGKPTSVVTAFDKVLMSIGFRAPFQNIRGLPVVPRTLNKPIKWVYWKGFLRKNQLDFTLGAKCLLEKEGDWWVVRLKNCTYDRRKDDEETSS